MSIHTSATVHPTAVIEPGAEIGPGVRIGAYSVVGPEVELGPDVVLHSHVAIAGVTRIGAATTIFPFASIGHVPQDLKYAGERVELVIGARNRIREHCTMNPGTAQGGGVTRVGDDCLFMMSTHVAHDCIVGNRVILANNATLAGHCVVEDGAILGGLAGVHQYVRIGRGAMIGGLAGVVADVIPFGSVTGERGHLAGLNLVGLKRAGLERAQIHGLRAAFAEIFEGAGTLQERTRAALERHPGNALVAEVAGFILAGFRPLLHRPGLTPVAGGGLAIVAGRGLLPRLLAEDSAARGRPYRVVAFRGTGLAWAGGHPVIAAEFEKPGRLFAALREAGCDEVVLAGGMERPRLNPLRFDGKMLALAPKVLAGMRAGDDATLGLVARIFEAEGLTLRAAHEILGGLLMPEGVLTRTRPSAADEEDAARAAEIVAALGRADVGQGAVVAQGLCLGLETIQGTDAMLGFVAATGAGARPDAGGARGVLLKAAKPGQDRRMDLPAVGPGTIAAAAAAGIAGIAAEAGAALLLDREATVAAADAAGLFLWGRRG